MDRVVLRLTPRGSRYGQHVVEHLHQRQHGHLLDARVAVLQQHQHRIQGRDLVAMTGNALVGVLQDLLAVHRDFGQTVFVVLLLLRRLLLYSLDRDTAHTGRQLSILLLLTLLLEESLIVILLILLLLSLLLLQFSPLLLRQVLRWLLFHRLFLLLPFLDPLLLRDLHGSILHERRKVLLFFHIVRLTLNRMSQFYSSGSFLVFLFTILLLFISLLLSSY